MNHLPVKMVQIECCETSEHKIQTGNYPEENIQHSEQGEIKKKVDADAISVYYVKKHKSVCRRMRHACPVNKTNYLFVCPVNNTNHLYVYSVSMPCQRDKLFLYVCPVNNMNDLYVYSVSMPCQQDKLFLYVCHFNNANDLYAYSLSMPCQQDKLFVRMLFQ
jgi:hypothetical protein